VCAFAEPSRAETLSDEFRDFFSFFFFLHSACILECLAFADARGKKLMKFRNRWTYLLHVLDHVKRKVPRGAREYDAGVPSRINSSFRAAVIGIRVKLHRAPRKSPCIPLLPLSFVCESQARNASSSSQSSATLRKKLNSLCRLVRKLCPSGSFKRERVRERERCATASPGGSIKKKEKERKANRRT
jgi:hypothetical protein